MRILVIGGTGFIGPCVVDRLAAQGHRVAVFHRGNSVVELPRGVESIFGNRNNLPDYAATFRRFAPDVVIDLILSSGRQARDLMDTFRGLAVRVVGLSSMDVYRACAVLHGLEDGPLEPMPLTEDSPLRTKLRTYPPQQVTALQAVFAWLEDDYDKIPVERELLADPLLPGTILRLPMVYGPRDPLQRLQPLLREMEAGQPEIVFSASTAQWRAPRGYVENVAAAVALAATSEAAVGRVYNVAAPDALTELEWARQVGQLAGWSGEFRIVPDELAPSHLRPMGNYAQHWVADTSRIRRELGYRETVGLEQSLLRTIAWTRAHLP